MTALAVAAGLSPRQVGDLDEDELAALSVALNDRARQEAWTNLHEVMCGMVEAQWALLAKLEAGVAVVQVKSTKQPREINRYPRPEWVAEAQAESSEDEGVIVVHRVGDALKVLKGGKE